LKNNSILGSTSHGGEHSYTPVNQEAATINATKIVAALTERNKLDKS
jgi:hypothetical protein